MWTRPKPKEVKGPTKTCPVCEKEVALYKDRFSLHAAGLGLGMCAGAGMSVGERVPETVNKPTLGAQEIALCQSLKSALALCGYRSCQVFVQIEGLQLVLTGYLEIKSFLPHLQRYGATLQKSTFSRVCVQIPFEKIERVCAFLHRKAKRAKKTKAEKAFDQLDLFCEPERE